MARSGPRSICRRKPSCMPWSGANLPERPPAGIKKATDLIDWVRGLAPGYLQLGSGQTLGHGIVQVRWTGKEAGPRPPGAPGQEELGQPIRPVRRATASFTSSGGTDGRRQRRCTCSRTGKRPARPTRRP